MEIKLPPALTAQFVSQDGWDPVAKKFIDRPGLVRISFGDATVVEIQLTESESSRMDAHGFYGSDEQNETELCGFVAGWLKARWGL